MGFYTVLISIYNYLKSEATGFDNYKNKIINKYICL